MTKSLGSRCSRAFARLRMLGGVIMLTALAAQPAMAQSSQPSFSAPDVEVTEGSIATFVLTLPHGFNANIRYSYETIDDTAKAGEDYTSATGHVVWSSGVTEAKVTVQTTSDDVSDSEETFKLRLYNMETQGFAANHNNWTSAFSISFMPSETTVTATIVESDE